MTQHDVARIVRARTVFADTFVQGKCAKYFVLVVRGIPFVRAAVSKFKLVACLLLAVSRIDAEPVTTTDRTDRILRDNEHLRRMYSALKGVVIQVFFRSFKRALSIQICTYRSSLSKYPLHL